MSIKSDVQQLNPGARVEFFVLDMTLLGGGLIRFHANSDQEVTWQGMLYYPWPIKGEGFARTSDQQPNPTISVANLDGSMSLLCMQYQSLVGAKVTRKRTFLKYLDGQPGADPSQEFTPEIWFVERKVSETREAVVFELASVLDFQGVQLPKRQIMADQCPAEWEYRGTNCGYTGPAVAKADNTPTTNPLEDDCGKWLSSCRMRVWPDGIHNFGGYPAAGLVRT